MGFLLIVGAAIIAELYQRNLQREYEHIGIVGRQMSADLNHELEVQAFSVRQMGLHADEFLHGRAVLVDDPFRHLVAVPAKGGFTLETPHRYRPDELGSLTGLGRLPKPETLAAREIAMAISLTPSFRAITERNADLPWVYYISAQRFVYLYPGVGIEDFFYTARLEEKPFFRDMVPARNPQRRISWSPVYEDEGGKGLMVTVSLPVYESDTFLGSLSIDVGLKTILAILDPAELPYSTIALYHHDGSPMTNAGRVPARLDFGQLPEDSFVAIGGAQFISHAVPTADWHVVIKTDSSALYWKALKQTSLSAMMVVSLAVSLILTLFLLRALYQVKTLSAHDGLTGLYNRRCFEEIGRREFAIAQRNGKWLGLAICDIDYFKSYNDYYGHQEGDRILRHVAETLQSTMRRATDGIFRVGGEEFAILVNLEDPSQLAPMMERLRESVRALDIHHAHSTFGKVTISVGAIAVVPGAQVDFDQFYRTADEALYQAKQQGRDRVAIKSISSVA